MKTTEHTPQPPNPNGFEQVMERDPLGHQFLDLLEGWMAIVGALATASTMVFWDLELSLGCLVGWWTVQLNIAVVRRLMRAMLAGGTHHRLAAVALGFKMIALLGGVWAALKFLPIAPVGFLLGFTAVLTGLVIGSVVWAPRQGDRGAQRQPPEDMPRQREVTCQTPRPNTSAVSLAQDG
ncbi:MAG: ATP synthase subunit I [Myxococcota bacterium]